MKPTEQTCDLQRIDDYLDERLSEALASEFERHLCDCERCRNELQKRSAEPDVWRDAAALLGPDSTPDSARDSSRYSSLSSQSDSVHYPELGSLRAYGNDSSGSGEQATDEHKVSQRERYVLSVLDSLAPTDDPEMLGRVGDYEISGVVGVGGMGAVLKGFDKSLRRVVAIKVMAPHLAHSGSARTRFQREARAAAAITHDNVIDIYAVSEAAGLPYLVMPYARGPSLQKRIDEGGPLAVVEVVRIGRQIAAGLSAAHEQGLVHRDIKPANILLSDGIERLWITDFGVARAMDDASMTQTGVIAGTPQYMSPEQARGESVDHRSDLFSLGSVLYTACTGRPPFRSEAAYGILRRITDSDPRPIREINPDIPEWLCEIIARLQAKHPADRFESASEVVDLLDGCLAHLQQPHQVELPPSLRGKRLSDGTKSGQAVEIDHSGEEHQPTQQSQQTQQALPSSQPQRLFIKRVFIMTGSILLAGLFSLLTMQLTNPTDIAGHWSGESWQHVSLASVDEASDWYSGTFIDSAGRRGAVRLEWSRLQRRYNGRWKVGDAESGEITLRAGENGILRGAVSVDPDSQLAPDSPRLLEFAWQPASKEAQRDFESQTAQLKTTQPQRKSQELSQQIARAVSVKSPTPGVIVKVSDRVQLNALVKKGDLIVKVEPTQSASFEQGQQQLSALEQQIEAYAQKIEATKSELEAVKQICEAIEDRAKTFEAVKEKNAIEISAGRETESTKLKIQGDLDTAIVDLKKAEADVIKVEMKRQSYQQEQMVLQKKAIELQIKLTELERLQIVAPVTGTITYLAAFSKGDVVKEGDVICEITPEIAHASSTFEPPNRARGAGLPTAQPTSVVEPKLSNSIQGLSAFGPASGLAKRLRESRQRLAGIASNLEEHETKLKTLQLELLALREQQVQIPEQDVQRREQLEFQQKVIDSTTRATEEEIKIAKQAQKDAEAEMSEAEHEWMTILKMLQNQLSTAQRQLESQRASRERMEQLYKQGLTSQETMSKAEQVVVEIESEVRQLELLLDFYRQLGKG